MAVGYRKGLCYGKEFGLGEVYYGLNCKIPAPVMCAYQRIRRELYSSCELSR